MIYSAIFGAFDFILIFTVVAKRFRFLEQLFILLVSIIRFGYLYELFIIKSNPYVIL
jgi:Mn2+/Fe2+ NRAMP family transporter